MMMMLMMMMLMMNHGMNDNDMNDNDVMCLVNVCTRKNVIIILMITK